MKKNNLFIIILVILAILVPLITYYIDSRNKQEGDKKIVVDYNDFYTVDSCINRVITYINGKDTESLMLVINDKYRKKNKIGSNNVLNFFNQVLDESSFVSKKMYYSNVDKKIMKFYVYGQNLVEGFDGIKDKKDIYFIVYLNLGKKTFSIEPYDGKIFLGGDNSE